MTDNPNAREFLRKARKYDPVRATTQQRDSIVWLLHRSCDEDSMYMVPLFNLVLNHFLWYDTDSDSGDLQAGTKALRRMQEIDRDSYTTRHAQVYYSYYVLKNFALAIEQLDEILRITPYSSGILSGRGLSYRRLGRHQEFLDDFALIAKVNPLGTDWGFHRNIAQTLIQFGQTQEARIHVDKLKNSPSIADYFYFSINSAVLEGRLDQLDSLVAEAKQSVHQQLNEARQKDLEFSRDRIHAFYRRDYRTINNLYEKYKIRRPLDSAALLLLLGDSVASHTSFLMARDSTKSRHQKMKGSQQGDQAWINYAVCLAALKETGWRDEFARIKAQLAGLQYPAYYAGYLRACLLAGDYERAMTLLKEWRQENIPFFLANAYVGPFQLLLKEHPLLDPLRKKPGFEELWEGNHLKLKPLKVPHNLR